jgi:hypothetical protein
LPRLGTFHDPIARAPKLSPNGPPKAKGYRLGAPPPFPLTPEPKKYKVTKPRASISPTTNLHNHRRHMDKLVQSPLKRFGLTGDAQPWSPAFNIADNVTPVKKSTETEDQYISHDDPYLIYPPGLLPTYMSEEEVKARAFIAACEAEREREAKAQADVWAIVKDYDIDFERLSAELVPITASPSKKANDEHEFDHDFERFAGAKNGPRTVSPSKKAKDEHETRYAHKIDITTSPSKKAKGAQPTMNNGEELLDNQPPSEDDENRGEGYDLMRGFPKIGQPPKDKDAGLISYEPDPKTYGL